MDAYRLPAIDEVSNLNQSALYTVLDHLFEPSLELCELCAPHLQKSTYSSYQDLIISVKSDLENLLASESPEQHRTLDKILGSHPRLGENNVSSEQSRAEQARLQSGDDDEAQLLRSMNAQYEETFPGLRYVVFVDGRSRREIMNDMQTRITQGDSHEERRKAIDAMCAIAADRSRKLARESASIVTA